MSEETLESIVGSGEPPITSDEEVAEVVEEEKEEPEKTPDPPEKKRSVLDDLREERSKRRELQEENERLKTKPVDEDEAVKQARSWFDKEYERRAETDRIRKQEVDDKALEDKLAEIESLKSTFDDFDEDKVHDFAERNKIKSLETAYWRLKAEGGLVSKPKPKLPSGSKTTDEIKTEKSSPEADSGKSIFQIVREEVARRGIK